MLQITIVLVPHATKHVLPFKSRTKVTAQSIRDDLIIFRRWEMKNPNISASVAATVCHRGGRQTLPHRPEYNTHRITGEDRNRSSLEGKGAGRGRGSLFIFLTRNATSSGNLDV